MGKANWYYSSRDNKWVLLGKGGATLAIFNDNGVVDFPGKLLTRGAGTLQALNVGTLATIQAMVVAGQGTIRDLRVATLASVQALNVNAQGSVQNLNVGTLATIQAAVIAGQGTVQNLNVGTMLTARDGRFDNVGSIDSLRVRVLQIGSFAGQAAPKGLFTAIGTSAGIAAVGSGASAWGTIANMTGVVPSMVVIGNPNQIIDGHIGIGGFHIPTNDVLNVLFQNTKPDSAGSVIPYGWTVFGVRV